MTLTTLGYKLRVVDAMNNLRLWLTGPTPGLEFTIIDAMNNSVQWLT